MGDFIEVYEKQEVEVKQQDNALVSRQAQEVQAAMVIAKRFPRSETEAFSRIMESCGRKSLAEQAQYTYPRGGTRVEGPSIRLAEVLARAWGNIDCGIIELEQSKGKSEMMAYAWDLETNTRVTKVFQVAHLRDKKGGAQELTESRDIYELTANMGSRRLRACILSVIPGDVVDAAIEKCKKTLTDSYKEPLGDRIKNMVVYFKEKLSVSKEQIEKYLGYNVESCIENDFLKLKGIVKSINDGMSAREDYFDFGDAGKEKIKDKALKIFAKEQPEKYKEITESEIKENGAE